jgi:hypothetical protein
MPLVVPYRIFLSASSYSELSMMANDISKYLKLRIARDEGLLK